VRFHMVSDGRRCELAVGEAHAAEGFDGELVCASASPRFSLIPIAVVARCACSSARA
jgi:hypothetical protein